MFVYALNPTLQEKLELVTIFTMPCLIFYCILLLVLKPIKIMYDIDITYSCF